MLYTILSLPLRSLRATGRVLTRTLTPKAFIIMALFKTEDQRELATLREIEHKIERREKFHHVLIAALGGLLAVSLAAHIYRCKK